MLLRSRFAHRSRSRCIEGSSRSRNVFTRPGRGDDSPATGHLRLSDIKTISYDIKSISLDGFRIPDSKIPKLLPRPDSLGYDPPGPGKKAFEVPILRKRRDAYPFDRSGIGHAGRVHHV